MTRTPFNYDTTDFSANLDVIENSRCTVVLAVADLVHLQYLVPQAKYAFLFFFLLWYYIFGFVVSCNINDMLTIEYPTI